MTIYANLCPTSRYSSQATKQPFPVELCDRGDIFIFSGNQNEYSVLDLEFFVKREKGFCKLKPPSNLLLFRALVEFLRDQDEKTIHRYKLSDAIYDGDTKALLAMALLCFGN